MTVICKKQTDDIMEFEQYNLTENPFRTVPGVQSDEIIWAGFPDIKAKFEQRIKRAISLRNSGVVLNWGEYGSGKTHAAKFFGKQSELKRLADEAPGVVPFYIYVTLPKGKAPVEEVFTAIIDKLDLTHIRQQTSLISEELIEFIDNTFNDSFIQSCIKAVFTDIEEIDDKNLIKRFLYGLITAKDFKILQNIGILRKMKSDDDYIKFLAALFSTLTYNKKVYSCVILWIDEFEDIITLNNSSLDKINSLLRDLFDNTPNNLLLFLNLTQSSLFTAEDLSRYITESVRSRIRDRVSFDIPDSGMIRDYLIELLDQFRVSRDQNIGLYPFDEEVVLKVLSDFRNAPVRKYNEVFSTLLEIGKLEGVDRITLSLYEDNESEFFSI